MKLNKIKDVLSSVKVKLFLSLSITVLLIILFMILVNNFALEQFYLYKKQITLKTVYESINEYYKKQNRDDDIQTELEKLSIKNNFDIKNISFIHVGGRVKQYVELDDYRELNNFNKFISILSPFIFLNFDTYCPSPLKI